MEDSRRTRAGPRPESSASNRMTPPQSSSNSTASSANLRPATGGSSLLQERIREQRRGAASRQSKRRSLDMGDRAVHSSPVTKNDERRPSSSGMGVKQIEEHVSKLTKENFNLKLELHHRRERQTGLEVRLEEAERRLEKAEEKIVDQQKLFDINDQLASELDKRDQALEEAVGIIVGLEDKVERLMQEREVVKNFETNSSYYRTSFDDPSSSPPQFDKKQNIKPITRMPSFLSENSEGADALRSLYLPHNQSYDSTLPKLLEEGSVDGLDRVERLSVLSESSFVSIYGTKNVPEVEKDDDLPRRLRTKESVEKWIDERPAASNTPLRVRSDLRRNKYLSINDVVESPLQRLEKLKHTLERNNSNVASARAQLERGTGLREVKTHQDDAHRVFKDKTSFEHQQGLPPTPDTFSTSTLSHFKSDSRQVSQGSKDKNKLPILAGPLASYNTYQATITRPRSAGETINSRREDHGWDTETQDDISSTISTFITEQPNQSRRTRTPNLFSFSDLQPSDDEDSFADFGRDMMFSHEPGLPAHSTTSRYETLRRGSLPDQPNSDDTIRPAPRFNAHQYGTQALDSSPYPSPPMRRSSLSHGSKLRESQNSSSTTTLPHQVAESSVSTKNEPKKKPGLATRLFNRSDTAPPLKKPLVNGKPQPQTYVETFAQDDERGTATPPPIKRSRDTSAPLYRPSSAGVQQSLRRSSAFGMDPIEADGNINDDPAGGDDGLSKKKWFGLGRSLSVRKT